MKPASARLLGLVVIWGAMWMGTAYLLAGTAKFAAMIPLLTAGSAGPLLPELAFSGSTESQVHRPTSR